jgi:hypothetical protein
MDYAGLQAAIGDYLNRGDLYGSIPTFIALAEAQLLRRLTKAGVQGAVARATTTIQDEYELCPTDYTGYLSHTIYDPDDQRWKPLEAGTTTGIATIKSDGRAAEPHMPDRFAVVGNSFWYSPTPDQQYTVDLIYWAAFPPLDGTHPTNWILSAYPDVYLYGALSHAVPYLRVQAESGAELPLATWQQYYDTAVAEIIEAERRKRGTQFTPSFRATDAPPNYGRRRWLWDITTGVW